MCRQKVFFSLCILELEWMGVEFEMDCGQLVWCVEKVILIRFHFTCYSIPMRQSHKHTSYMREYFIADCVYNKKDLLTYFYKYNL